MPHRSRELFSHFLLANDSDWHTIRGRRNDLNGPRGVWSREQGILRPSTVLWYPVPLSTTTVSTCLPLSPVSQHSTPHWKGGLSCECYRYCVHAVLAFEALCFYMVYSLHFNSNFSGI